MDQKAIWDYFQGEADHVFDDNEAAYHFVLSRLSPPMRVLNIGIGNALFERLALEKGLNVDSLDPSEAAVKKLEQISGLSGRVGRVEEIPWDNAFFDAVVACEVLEHLSLQELELGLAEVKRVLRKGGKFLGTVPFEEVLDENAVVCPHCGERFHRWGHQQSFTTSSLEAALSPSLRPTEVTVKKFVPWRKRSFAYKISGVLKLVLLQMGVRIANCRIFFVAEAE